MNEYLAQAVAVPRWLTLVLITPLVTICLLLAFVVVPSQQELLLDNRRQTEIIKEYQVVIDDNKKVILYNKAQLERINSRMP